jgi:hypothetical protein
MGEEKLVVSCFCMFVPPFITFELFMKLHMEVMPLGMTPLLLCI